MHQTAGSEEPSRTGASGVGATRFRWRRHPGSSDDIGAPSW
ncbi:MAG: hypothetical protein ACKODX_19945 [Gemmata sp.]